MSELKHMAKAVAKHHPITSGPTRRGQQQDRGHEAHGLRLRDDELVKLKILALHEARYALVG